MDLNIPYFLLLLIVAVSGQTCSDDDWHLFEDNLYHVTGTLTSYFDAALRCQGFGGHLAILSTPERNAFAASLIPAPSGEDEYYWIGFNDLDVEGEYLWVDGTPLGDVFTPWGQNLPHGRDDADCGYITISNNATSDGRWGDRPCDHIPSISGAICQRPLIRKNVNQTCWTTTWHQLNDTEYLVSRHKESYAAARRTCQEFGGDLAIIDSLEVTNFIKLLLPRTSGYRDLHWFGLTKSKTSGQYEWIDGSPLTGYSNWHPVQPDNTGYCMDMYGDADDSYHGKWNDNYCLFPGNFICERPISYKDVEAKSVCSFDNWIAFGNSFYFVETLYTLYTSAQGNCRKLGGDLAMLNTSTINNFVLEHLPPPYSPGQRYYKADYWFGLDDLKTEGSFVWSDGTPLSGFNNWAPGQPAGYHYLDDGVTIYYDGINRGGWKVSRRYEGRGYVCERPRVERSNWVEYGTSMYLLKSRPQVFSDARASCRCLGGDLAMPKSLEENNFLVNLTASRTQSFPSETVQYWIGLDNNTELDSFKWVDGTCLEPDQARWSEGEPSAMKDCGSIISTNGYGRWNSSACCDTHPFICQKSGWEVYTEDQSFYVESHISLSFANARAYCQSYGGDLATIESPDIRSYLVVSLRKSTIKRSFYWIGLTNTMTSTRDFAWVDGSHLDHSLSSWFDASDINGNGCVSFPEKGGAWNRSECSDVLPFICEKRTLSATFFATRSTSPATLATRAPTNSTKTTSFANPSTSPATLATTAHADSTQTTSFANPPTSPATLASRAPTNSTKTTSFANPSTSPATLATTAHADSTQTTSIASHSTSPALATRARSDSTGATSFATPSTNPATLATTAPADGGRIRVALFAGVTSTAIIVIIILALLLTIALKRIAKLRHETNMSKETPSNTIENNTYETPNDYTPPSYEEIIHSNNGKVVVVGEVVTIRKQPEDNEYLQPVEI